MNAALEQATIVSAMTAFELPSRDANFSTNFSVRDLRRGWRLIGRWLNQSNLIGLFKGKEMTWQHQREMPVRQESFSRPARVLQ